MPTTSHLEKLNGPQRKAVTFGEVLPDNKGVKCGPLLIVAGAGTGKTDTLAHRVAHLVIHGVDPGRILMLTFTRRAAIEMRRRAFEIAKKALDDALGGVSQTITQRLSWTGTFHSIGNRLLRHYAKHLKLDPQFSVMDRGDSADLMDGLRQELGLATKEQRFPRKETCLQIYSYRVNTQKPLKETLEQQYPWCAQWEADLTRLYRAYVEQKQRAAILDYDDLLLYWHVMMSEPRLAQHVSAHFDHVLVDEYQDTNKLQAQILHAMRPDGSGLAVVGDDAQAIYSFRAAAVENILGFPDRFNPKAEVITLAQNYRSTQEVLDVSNSLMADAPRQHRKHLLSVRGKGARARIVTVDELQTQAEYVCSEILRRREANVPLKRQAVLFRSASHSDVLEVELGKRKIPYTKYGGLKFLEAAHIKDLMSVLRWADNPRNSLAVFRVAQLLPGMGPANARHAVEHLAANNYAFASLKTFAAPAPAKHGFEKLTELLLALADPQRQWPGQTHMVREWYRPHFERIYEHFHTRLGDLDQLEMLSGQYPSRERFLTELTLDPPNATSDLAGTPMLDEDYLTLTTIHSAKGMEWDTVYLLNVVDGSFPSEFATGKAELIEEERRLFYVALTRAQNDLVLMAPLKFHLTNQSRQGDAHVYGGRSRFLTEKVLKTLEPTTFQGSSLGGDIALQGGAAESTLDITARMKEMW
ncbi:MAG: ATP-dependent helicase UvrD/PcrA [Gammaproteobacteria bacterium]|jgi:DNA helicase-2/ATP-dependent DNA helicase PcrA|nr:ATP-dependent helicase UvrD/PcrA [Gammaproteobacteria bacterium]